MNEEKVLTEEIAEELVRVADDLKYDERLDFLRSYTSITLEAAEMIGNEFNRWFHFPSIKEIEPNAADHLAKVSVLTFDALETISPETAEALAKHKGSSLELGGTWQFSSEIAYKLSFHFGRQLYLPSIESISDFGPIVSEMPSADNPGNGYAPDLLTRKGKWSGFGGGLSFPSINAITEDEVDCLASLCWGWLQIPPPSSEFGEFTFIVGAKSSNLIFENLTSINLNCAKAFCQTRGILDLGITSLSDDIAKCFEDFQGAGLILNKLENLNDSSAQSLAKFTGKLELPSELQAKVDSYKKG
jgi:hypothetical protein